MKKIGLLGILLFAILGGGCKEMEVVQAPPQWTWCTRVKYLGLDLQYEPGATNLYLLELQVRDKKTSEILKLDDMFIPLPPEPEDAEYSEFCAYSEDEFQGATHRIAKMLAIQLEIQGSIQVDEMILRSVADIYDIAPNYGNISVSTDEEGRIVFLTEFDFYDYEQTNVPVQLNRVQ